MKFAVLLCLVGLIIAVSADCELSDKTYKVEESFQPDGTCMIQTCTGDNELTGKGCSEGSVIDPSEWNYIPQDNSKPYPQCCPRYEKKN